MNRSRGTRREIDVYTEPREVGNAVPPRPSRTRRPRWYLPACTLIVLMITELVLIGTVFVRFGTSINYQQVPIVSAPESTGAIELPTMDTTGNADDELDPDVNLAVGNTPIYEKAPIDPNVINILVLGLDTRTPGGNGRSDVNMIVSINRKNKTIKLVSMLRDTLVPIEGHDFNRLNSAYVYGGPGLSINTINSIYNMDIQRFVKVDFFAIMDIVDAVGGVDINMTDAEIAYMHKYKFGNISSGAGVKHLNGAVALEYARMRKIDSDFGRVQRQRNVLEAVLKKARAMGVVKALDLMNKLLPQVTTNISTNEMVGLGTDVIGMSGSPEQLSLPAQGTYTGKYYNKMAILAVDFEKNKQILKDFLYGSK